MKNCQQLRWRKRGRHRPHPALPPSPGEGVVQWLIEYVAPITKDCTEW